LRVSLWGQGGKGKAERVRGKNGEKQSRKAVLGELWGRKKLENRGRERESMVIKSIVVNQKNVVLDLQKEHPG